MIPEPYFGPADNEIWYTSSNGNVVNPSDSFGVSIVSNEYNNGKGVITFDGPVTSIGYGAFSGCFSLTSVTIPNGVTSIRDNAFLDCTSLTSVTIGNGVTSIGYGAFYYCSALTSIIFEGTTEQWNAITKGEEWNFNALATYVQCSDGRVEL